MARVWPWTCPSERWRRGSRDGLVTLLASGMAEEGRQGPGRGGAGALQREDVPSLDAEAVRRSYRHHRARRQARVEHVKRSRRAGARFWVVLVLLVVACVVIAMTTWREIGRLFGL